jgi:hypothetical protein
MLLAPVPQESQDLVGYRNDHPLMRMMPVFHDLLGEAVRNAGCVFAIADAGGTLLWVEGDPKARGSAEKIHFLEGADWSEYAAGTNAPGTALAVGRPVQIIGREHFNLAVSPWSCAAAPIGDPDTGRLLGVIDVTGGELAVSPAMLALIRATAKAVQAEFARMLAVDDLAAYRAHESSPRRTGGTALVSPGGRVIATTSGLEFTRLSGVLEAADGSSELPDGRRLVLEPVGTTGYVVARFVEAVAQHHSVPPLRLSVLGRDAAALELNGRVIKLGPRHSEIVTLLALAKDGLSLEQLMTGLSPVPLNPTSLRVDMSRLRTRLGEDVLTSRPYLLRCPVRSDLDLVGDLLTERRVTDALNAYPGPLLPHSQAPGLLEPREVLHQRLRQAVLTSYDARLIAQWLDTPGGADDASGWAALARLLPEGSPRRSQADARVEALLGTDGSKPQGGPATVQLAQDGE